jgi:tetratricopeptide (TPR) repeat protein
VLLALCAAAFAFAGAARAEDVLKLKDGSVLRGRAKAYDEATHTVTFVTQDGSERKLPLDGLDRLSAYKIAKSRAPDTDGKGQLRIGNIARDAQLYRYALGHYANARKADPSLAPQIDKEMAVLRREAADYCMSNAKNALASHDSEGAEKWLTTLVQKLPDEAPTAEARTMLEDLYSRTRAAKVEKVESSTPEQIKAELKQGKKYYDSMLDNIRRGLIDKTTSASRRYHEAAWSDGEKAMKELDKTQKKYSDAEAVQLLDHYRGVVREQMVGSQLALASLLSTSTNYKGAQEAINKALSIDPQNHSALEARARTEMAASNSSVFGWR